MDLSAIQAALTSLKAATDISKSIFDINSAIEIQDKVIELQAALLKAQTSAISATTAQFELQEKVRKLEEQIKSTDEWGDQERRYSLVCPWKGPAQVYALKKSDSEGEEPHFLCTNCFHIKRKVILNPKIIGSRMLLICPSCKATNETRFRGIGRPHYAEECDD